MTLGVVIPVFRAGERLNGVVDGLRAFAREKGIACRVVLVEDAGGEADAVRALAARHAGVTAVLLEQNVGQQKATYLGLPYVRDCYFVATMDDDGQHPPALLGEMLEKIRAGAEICYAVPSREGLSPFRRAGATLRDALFSLCTKKPRGIKVGAYRVMTGALARKLAPEKDGFIYLSAAAFKHRPRAACVCYPARPTGATSYTAGKLFQLYGGLLFHYTPMKVFFHFKRTQPPCPTAVVPGKGFL